MGTGVAAITSLVGSDVSSGRSGIDEVEARNDRLRRGEITPPNQSMISGQRSLSGLSTQSSVPAGQRYFGWVNGTLTEMIYLQKREVVPPSGTNMGTYAFLMAMPSAQGENMKTRTVRAVEN